MDPEITEPGVERPVFGLGVVEVVEGGGEITAPLRQPAEVLGDLRHRLAMAQCGVATASALELALGAGVVPLVRQDDGPIDPEVGAPQVVAGGHQDRLGGSEVLEGEVEGADRGAHRSPLHPGPGERHPGEQRDGDIDGTIGGFVRPGVHQHAGPRHLYLAEELAVPAELGMDQRQVEVVDGGGAFEQVVVGQSPGAQHGRRRAVVTGVDGGGRQPIGGGHGLGGVVVDELEEVVERAGRNVLGGHRSERLRRQAETRRWGLGVPIAPR